MKRRYSIVYYTVPQSRQGSATTVISQVICQSFPCHSVSPPPYSVLDGLQCCLRGTQLLEYCFSLKKNCFNGRKNTVLVATVVLPPLFHCFAVSAAGWLHRWMHRRSFPSMEVASAISTIANYCNRQYCKVFILNLHIISIRRLYAMRTRPSGNAQY